MKFLNRTTMILLGAILLVLMVSGYTIKKGAVSVNAVTTEEVTATGKIENLTAVTQCLTLLKKNLNAANDKDLTGYVETLVKKARQDTEKEMATFFETYSLKHTLLSFEVIKEDKASMLVAAQQQTLNEGTSDFRNHISQVHHTFVKVENAWYLQESLVTDTKFLD